MCNFVEQYKCKRDIQYTALKRLSTIKYRKFIDNNLNKELNILFEKYSDGILSGWAENYIRVNVESKNNFINQIKKVKLMDNHNINGILV